MNAIQQYDAQIAEVKATLQLAHETISQLTAGLLSNGCEVVTDDDGNLWVRNVRAEKALGELAITSADLVNQRFAANSHAASVEALTKINQGLVQAVHEIRRVSTNAAEFNECLQSTLMGVVDMAEAALRQAGQT